MNVLVSVNKFKSYCILLASFCFLNASPIHHLSSPPSPPSSFLSGISIPILHLPLSPCHPFLLPPYQTISFLSISPQLDQIRVSSSKSSPLMEAVKFCMPHIDAEVMEKLVPRLVDIIKSGIGVSTKVRG